MFLNIIIISIAYYDITMSDLFKKGSLIQNNQRWLEGPWRLVRKRYSYYPLMIIKPKYISIYQTCIFETISLEINGKCLKKLRNEHQTGFSDKRDIIYIRQNPPQH